MQNEILWTSGFFNERFAAPISPLGWSMIGPLIEELALRDPLRFLGYPKAETIPLTRLWHGHPYANALAFEIYYKCFPDFILPEDAFRYFPDGAIALRKSAPYPRWYDLPRFVLSLLRAFFADPFNVSPLNNYRHWMHYTRVHDASIASLRARVNALAQSNPREIFAALRDAERTHLGVLRIHRWSLIDAELSYGLLKRLVDGDAERVARLVADVPNKTMQVDAALREIPNPKHLHRPQVQVFQISNAKFKAFLAEHGHRSFSLDIAAPTFAEEPEQVVRLLKATEDGGPLRETGKKFPSSVVGLPSGTKGALFNWVLSLTRHYVALREDQRYYWQKSLALSRHLYLMLADRLVADSVIADRNEVFYATHNELADYFGGKLPKPELTQSICARQLEWCEYQREYEQSPIESYPPFLQGDVPLPRVGAGSPRQRKWRGRAVSPGIARGVARVVQSANELSRVQPGEILVAPATDPAWTPIFARIAGLVVERGGVLSHSAVVAREYHLPAVAGIANITAEIKEGELIEVDGSKGIVWLVQQ